MTTARPGVLVCCHGHLAEGLVDAAVMIVGSQRDLVAVGLRPDQDPDDLLSEIRRSTDSIAGPWLVLVDLLGGTPSNTVVRWLATSPERAGSRVVAGANLGMLVDVLLRAGQDGGVPGLADAAMEAGVAACAPVSVPALAVQPGSAGPAV